MRNRLIFGGIVAAVALTAPSVGWAQGAASDLATVKARGSLIMLCFPNQDSTNVAVNLERGPMKRVGTAEDFKGLDVDLMAEFAQRLGVRLEISTVASASFDELIPSLISGAGDVIASSFSITQSRRQVLDFSEPYQTVRDVVVTRRDSRIAKESDLPRFRGALIPGSSIEERLRQGAARKFLYVEFTRDQLTAVAERRADFAVLETSGELVLLKEFSNLRTALVLPGSEDYALAFRKGSDLKPVADALISELKETGRLGALLKKWLGSSR